MISRPVGTTTTVLLICHTQFNLSNNSDAVLVCASSTQLYALTKAQTNDSTQLNHSATQKLTTCLMMVVQKKVQAGHATEAEEL